VSPRQNAQNATLFCTIRSARIQALLRTGFAALIEYDGRRILFDTGNNARIFEHNVKALGVDLRKIDFVVISHRHADHTSGITYLLTVNPSHGSNAA
jgi:metal-dependent hydrolase (beta-lactamase superfamily II)